LALLATMDWFNWALMIAWTVIGLAIYFAYGVRHSRLRIANSSPNTQSSPNVG
jgi:basic amino acid/polyamine antiporter, APA family